MDKTAELLQNPTLPPRDPPRLNEAIISTPQPDYQTIADELSRQGFVVVENFVTPLLLDTLREECRAKWCDGEFRHAGVGRGESFEIKPEIRNDQVMWLEPGGDSPAQQNYLQQLEALRLLLNREMYLGLFEFEGHMAIYPPGSFYAKHLDQFRGIGLRTVTAILYLNEAWQETDGGQLRIYTVPGSDEAYIDILPLGGRLVVFMSAEFMHEVLPAGRERMSITGWFKRRDDTALP